MSPKSFAIRIFLPDGNTDGVKIIAKSKWSGRGMVIPRPLFPEEKKREELAAPGVYILVSPVAEGSLPTIYIGSADPICTQLEQDDSNIAFWSWAAVFTSKKDQLNQVHIEYIAARLLHLAQEVKRANIDNQDVPKPPVLTEEEQTEAESFLAHMLSIIPLLGLTVFEKPNI